jgi:hypothetical protein
VRRELARCRRRSDCSGDALCILSGYSADPRGNGEMRAECLRPVGGVEERIEEPAPHPLEPATPMPVRADRLLESLGDPAR